MLQYSIKKVRMHYSLFVFILFLTTFFSTSCEQKKTEEVSPSKDTARVKSEELVSVDTSKIDTTALVKEPQIVIPDLKGKWTGTFDQRATTLRITEQNGNAFKGTITINYREVINQQISGTINEKTRELNMKDLLHSRYAGTYRGKLSEDLNSISGTFTQNVEKTKFSFNLKKQ